MKRLFIVFVCVSLTLLPLGGSSQLAPPLNGSSRWYYDIGGARPLSLPAASRGVFGVDASFGYGVGEMCRKFDPAAAIQAALVGTVDRLQQLALGGITTAILGLPLYLLAQANPQLYDQLKDALWKADAMYRLSSKTCDEMMRDIGEGRNPYEDYVILSRITDLKLRANAGSQDLTTAVREANSDNGLPWINGEWRGGRNQAPINVIGDTAIAGYNLLLGRQASDMSAPSAIPGGDATEPLVALWPAPGDAADWVTDVLGDQSFSVFDGGTRTSRAGRGLLPRHEAELTDVRTAFEDILAGDLPLTGAQLDRVSAPGRAITLELIETLRGLPEVEASIAGGRLAEEIAMARTIEQALYARRVLLSGRREPNIANSPARDEIDRSIRELSEEIETLMFENETRLKLVSHTASGVLSLRDQGDTDALDTEASTSADTDPISEGAVSSP